MTAGVVKNNNNMVAFASAAALTRSKPPPSDLPQDYTLICLLLPWPANAHNFAFYNQF